MKLTKTKLKQIIKEELAEDIDFDTAKRQAYIKQSGGNKKIIVDIIKKLERGRIRDAMQDLALLGPEKLISILKQAAL